MRSARGNTMVSSITNSFKLYHPFNKSGQDPLSINEQLDMDLYGYGMPVLNGSSSSNNLVIGSFSSDSSQDETSNTITNAQSSISRGSTESLPSLTSSGSSNYVLNEPKTTVSQVIKWIKYLMSNKKTYSFIHFIEQIQVKYYKHVKLSLLSDWLDTIVEPSECKYIEYYSYFLNYAELYHWKRITTDCISADKESYHRGCLSNIQFQIKYINYLIQNRKTEVSL